MLRWIRPVSIVRNPSDSKHRPLCYSGHFRWVQDECSWLMMWAEIFFSTHTVHSFFAFDCVSTCLFNLLVLVLVGNDSGVQWSLFTLNSNGCGFSSLCLFLLRLGSPCWILSMDHFFNGMSLCSLVCTLSHFTCVCFSGRQSPVNRWSWRACLRMILCWENARWGDVVYWFGDVIVMPLRFCPSRLASLHSSEDIFWLLHVCVKSIWLLLCWLLLCWLLLCWLLLSWLLLCWLLLCWLLLCWLLLCWLLLCWLLLCWLLLCWLLLCWLLLCWLLLCWLLLCWLLLCWLLLFWLLLCCLLLCWLLLCWLLLCWLLHSGQG